VSHRPDGGLPSVSDELSVENLVARLTAIPRTARQFLLSAEHARRRYRVGIELLNLLESFGLSESRDGVRYFDNTDLINVEFYRGGGPLTVSLRRFWPAMLKRLPDCGPVTYQLEYDATCPDPGHQGDCEYALMVPGGQRTVRIAPSAEEEPLTRFAIERPTRWPELPEAARAVVDTVRDVKFVRLPRRFAHTWNDIEFVHTTGLGDCAAVAEILVERGNATGVRTRLAYGLMLAPPFSLPHVWAEVLVDEVWVPVDPLLVNALVGWNQLDGLEWPAYRSPGAALCRLAGGYDPLGLHNNVIVELTFRAAVAG
jgi:hypothetical protein